MKIINSSGKMVLGTIGHVGTLLKEFVAEQQNRCKELNIAHQEISELLTVLRQTVQFPSIDRISHPSLCAQAHLIRADDLHLNVVLDILMPAGESLLWMPWLPHQVKPTRNPGNYQHVRFARWALMPRRSRCYDYTYAFSGQTHPIEPKTPASIDNLYITTNRLFNYLGDGVNMCLENDYANGLSKISEHCDDERQFGSIHDVVCWVTGPACRPLDIRVRRDKTKRQVPLALIPLCPDPANANQNRHLLRISLPEGLYAMCGRTFQFNYSHEFPEIHKTLYTRLIQAATIEREDHLVSSSFPETIDSFPIAAGTSSKGVSLLPFCQADWLKDNCQFVEEVLIHQVLPRLSKKQMLERDIADFREWCKERTSYTLRSFIK